MSRELQPRGFQESPYERPAEDWVCGWAASGHACPIGPTPNGSCIVTHECAPVRSGERWRCGRPAAHGGTCEDGPLPDGTCCRPVLPCQPARTLRAKRGRLARWATAVTVALLVFAVSGPMGFGVLSPGPVSSQHAPFETRCDTCHAAGVGGPPEWFSSSLTTSAETPDSARCQQCHATGRDPHGVDPAELAVLTQAAATQSSAGGGVVLALAGLGPGPPTNDAGELPCATCHQEHTGRDAVLTDVSNRQCQVCHTIKFSGFADGHPEFTDYPYARRTRIRFNHATHRTDHFPQEGKDFECRGCHNPDRQGQVMLVEGFEANCSSCHATDVEVPDGIAFIQLPGIDTELLSQSGVQIGDWPLLADIDQDARFSPYLRVMIAADPHNAEAFDALPGDVDGLIFPELGGDEDEAAAVGQIVWAIKELLYDLSTDRQEALKVHLDSGLRRTMPEASLAMLSGNFDFDLVSLAVRNWFPNLASEIAAQRRHRADTGEGYDLRSHRTHIVDSSAPSTGAPVWGWSVDFDTVSIRYQPRGHADPLIQSWLEAVVHPSPLTKPGAMEFAFEALASTESNGKCARCHSIDLTENARVVNWHQKRRDKRERGFTRYMHRPHLIQPELADCTACHSLEGETVALHTVALHTGAATEVAAEPADSGETDSDETGSAESADEPEVAQPAPEAAQPEAEPARNSAEVYAAGFADGNYDPSVFGSNFAPINHATCASCHQSKVASDSCLNCHDYHVAPAILHGIQANIVTANAADANAAEADAVEAGAMEAGAADATDDDAPTDQAAD